MSLLLTASFMSIFAFQATSGSREPWNNANRYSGFTIFASSNQDHFIECVNEEAYIYNRHLLTYETFVTYSRYYLHIDFNENGDFQCVVPDTQLAFEGNYFCSFNAQTSEYIRPGHKRFHQNDFYCRYNYNLLKFFKARCKSETENKIKIEFSGCDYNGSQITVYSICESYCPVIDVELGEDVTVEFSDHYTYEMFVLKCPYGSDFGKLYGNCLRLICDRKTLKWRLEKDVSPEYHFIGKNLNAKFVCEPKDERSESRSENVNKSDDEMSETMEIYDDSYIHSQADFLETENDYEYTNDPNRYSQFTTFESTENDNFIKCVNDAAYVYDFSSYETFVIFDKYLYNSDQFNENYRYRCVVPDFNTVLDDDYFCSFEENTSRYILPQSMRFHENYFVCKQDIDTLTFFKARCESGAAKVIRIDYVRKQYNGNEITVFSMCESSCPVIDVELDDDVIIEFSKGQDYEKFVLKCPEGSAFDTFENDVLELICDLKNLNWRLDGGKTTGEHLIDEDANVTTAFSCRTMGVKKENEVSGNSPK